MDKREEKQQMTISRWSSEPGSLSSGDIFTTEEGAGFALLEQTRRSIATLQQALTAEKNRCRDLETRLGSEMARRCPSPAGFGAIARCLEHERSENRQLHGTVLRQQKIISRLRRQVRAFRLRLTADSNSSSSSSTADDLDDNCRSDCETLLSLWNTDDCQRMVGHQCTDHAVVAPASVSRRDHTPEQLSSRCLRSPAPGDRNEDAEQHVIPVDTSTLRRRLRDTVETCQRLASALDDRRSATTCQEADQTPPANRSRRSTVPPSNVHKVTDDAHETDVVNSTTNLPTAASHDQLSQVQARLNEVEEMNARWQCYMEQRERYTQVLEQRCGELEDAVCQHQQQPLTENQQRRVDEILLEQRQKTEQAEQATLKTEEENRQLRGKLKQLTLVQQQNKVCIDQLLERLQETEALRRSELGTVDALRQQVNLCREDFESERLDRHRAQERVVNLERQVAALKQRLGVYEADGSMTTNQRSRWWQDTVGDCEGSLPLLVARGGPSSFPTDPVQRKSVSDSAPRSH